MTAFDKKVNGLAARHRWNIEKQARAAVPCYIIAAPTYEDAGKIVAVLNRCKGLHHETLTPIHYESWAVKVYDAGQIAAYRERERKKAALVDAFYTGAPLSSVSSFQSSPHWVRSVSGSAASLFAATISTPFLIRRPASTSQILPHRSWTPVLV